MPGGHDAKQQVLGQGDGNAQHHTAQQVDLWKNGEAQQGNHGNKEDTGSAVGSRFDRQCRVLEDAQIPCFLGTLLRPSHWADQGYYPENDKGHDHQGQQRVEHVGHRCQDHGDALTPLGDGIFFQQSAEKHAPAGYRYQQAHGGRGGVHHIGQHFTGDPEPVGDRLHGGAHGQGIEVIVQKNKQPQNPGRGQTAPLAAQPAGQGLAESIGATALDQQGDKTAVQTTDQDDPGGGFIHQHLGCYLGEAIGKGPAVHDDEGQDSAGDHRLQGPVTPYGEQ